MRSTFLTPVIVLAALLLSACEDPSNVGLGLIGESGGEPRALSLPVASFTPRDVADVTGGGVTLGSTNPTPRVIAGAVSDPLVGDVSAVAHLDFAAVAGISDAFRSGTVTDVELRLTRNYIYGDTTSTLTFEVLDIPADWEERAPVDTTISLGAVAAVASVPAADRQVVIPLPQDWIDANSEVLRSVDFTADFDGLALRSTDGNALMGFATSTARLRVVAAGDTVDYVANRALTTTTATHAAAVQDRLVQDGVGVGVTAVMPDTIDPSTTGINGVLVRIPVDTVLTSSQTPAGFVRPVLGALRLIGRTQETDSTFTDEFFADALLQDGEYVWPYGALPEQFFQDFIAGKKIELALSAPPTLFTTDPALLVLPGATAEPPAIVLMITRAGI